MVLKGPKRIQLSLCFRGWKTELNLRTRKRILVPRFLQTRSSSGIPFTKKKNNDVIFFGGASYCNSLNNSFLPLRVFLKSSESLIHYQQCRAIWAGEKQTDGIRSKHWFCSGYWNLLVLALLPWELQLIKYLKLFFFLSDKNQIVRVASHPTSLFSEGCVFDCPHLKTICLRFQMSPPLRALFNRFVIT